MSKKSLLILIFSILHLPHSKSQNPQPKDSTVYIQIGLLIDVSGSMNGLVHQAQTTLWQAMNMIKNYQLDGKEPTIEIALLSYGNNLYAENGHIKKVFDFSHNTDSIAKKLFLLEMGGGKEYCGMAIQQAVDSLSWKKQNTYKFIFIAGNEPFDQGPSSYKTACESAKENKIHLNTIYCGAIDEGIYNQWETPSKIGNGGYTNIDMNIETEELKTPYDTKLAQLYDQYQKTYFIENTNFQDHFNYKGEISPSYRDLIIYNFKNHRKEIDFLDRYYNNDWKMDSLIQNEIPEKWKNETPQKLKMKLFKHSQQRNTAKNALEIYIKKIEEYLLIKIGPQLEENTLDIAIYEIIGKQLEAHGFNEIKNSTAQQKD